MSSSGKTKIADLSLLNNILDDDLLIVTAKRLNEQNDLQHITYKSTVQDLFNSQNFGDLAYKDNITSANIDGKINISYIAGLGKLAEKNKIISSDISDAISCSQIAGLGDLARKNKIISSDIAGAISCSQIAGLKNLAKKDGINTQDIYTLYGYTYNERKEPDQLSAIDSMNIALEKIQLQLNDKQKQLDALPNAFISSVIVDSKNEDGETLATITVNGTATDIKGSKNKNIGVTNIGIGSIVSFAGIDIPSNTLECNGQEVNIADYEALYTVIGNSYSTGDESEGKFRLPNLNDKFIQGHSKTTVLGSSINAGLPNITGSFGAVLGSGSGAFYNNGAGHRIHASSSIGNNIGFSASRSNSIYGRSNTVQPPAVVLKYVIVFKVLNGNDTIINTISGVSSVKETDHGENSDGSTWWYRLFSDGWCEQGGVITLNTASNLTLQVNLKKSYANTKYNIITTQRQIGAGVNSSSLNPAVVTQDKNSFTVDNPWFGFCWETKGFIN